MAYVETLLSEYAQLTLPHILADLPLVTGLALLEARRTRLDPRTAVGWVDRCVIKANAETKAWFEARYQITERLHKP
jgi:hypothetical protein